jgi:hypothetical protein
MVWRSFRLAPVLGQTTPFYPARSSFIFEAKKTPPKRGFKEALPKQGEVEPQEKGYLLHRSFKLPGVFTEELLRSC